MKRKNIMIVFKQLPKLIKNRKRWKQGRIYLRSEDLKLLGEEEREIGIILFELDKTPSTERIEKLMNGFVQKNKTDELMKELKKDEELD